MNQERMMNVLLSPHVSEKSTRVADRHNQFVFRVAGSAAKPEIKRAVELMFDVKVADVRVINVRGKSKRFGRMAGTRSGWKKAYVTLQTGYDINLMGPE